MQREQLGTVKNNAEDRSLKPPIWSRQGSIAAAWCCLIGTSTQPDVEKLASLLQLPSPGLSFGLDGLKYLSMIVIMLLGHQVQWRFMWPSAAFVLIMAASVPFSIDLFHSGTVVALLFITLLVSMKVGGTLGQKRLVAGAIVGLLLVLVPSLFMLRETVFSPVTGIFGTRNEIARLSTYCAMLSFGSLWLSATWFGRALSFTSFVFSAGLCVYTESATALTTLLVFVVVFLVVRLVGWPPKPSEVAGFLIAIAASILAAPFLYQRFFQLTGRDLSLTGRTDIWEYAWKSVKERPLLGHGAEAFWISEGGRAGRTLLGDAAVHSHNTWIELFLSLGVVGGVLAIMVLSLQVILVLRTASPPSRSNIVLIVFIALTVVTVLYGFSEHAAYRPLYSIVYIYLGVSVSLMSAKK